MYTYGLTKKQCGVIFSNIKKGNLNLTEEFIKWMYNHVADYKHYKDSRTQDVMDRMKKGLELVFAQNYEEANETLINAYTVWHINFKEA